MKVVVITDRPKSAISILASDVQRSARQHDITICPVHPRANTAQLRMARAYGQQADVIHVAYWRSGDVLRGEPWYDRKPKILVHHNPYDLEKRDWAEYDALVVKNQDQARVLTDAYLIPHCVNLSLFTWGDEPRAYTPTVGMVAGRIEATKGIAPVAAACRQLGYRFLLVGRLPGSYLNEIEEAAGDCLDLRQDVTPDELVEAYHDMHVVVVNSKDGFESGPLIVLEGWATGTPVLARPVGLVPDVYNGDNLVLREGDVDDVADIAAHLQRIIENGELRQGLRRAGFRSVASRSSHWAARQFSLLYHRVAYAEPLVSVIVPTCNRADTLPQVLASIEAQTYPHIEIIICDDNSQDKTRSVYRAHRASSKHTIKYLSTGRDGYNLAMARNLGIIEAEGEILVFLDDRLAMEPDAVERFAAELRAVPGPFWLWGIKDDTPKSFVENFSAVRRQHVIRAGMFCERMDAYGGITRETHRRLSGLGFVFRCTDSAKAYQIRRSEGWASRKSDLIQTAFTLQKLYGGA
jgi:glycosyltransferase involved in cell wall biosynthesis